MSESCSGLVEMFIEIRCYLYVYSEQHTRAVGIYNLQQSTALKSWLKYTTFDVVKVKSEKLIK